MKTLFIFLIYSLYLFSNNILKVSANSMSYKNNKQTLVLEGGVSIKNGINFVKAQKAIAKLENKKIISYEAKNNIEFFYVHKNKSYHIKTNNIMYDVAKQLYILTGDIMIDDNMSNKIKANKITINKKEDTFIIEGKDQPVSLEFEIEQ